MSAASPATDRTSGGKGGSRRRPDRELFGLVRSARAYLVAVVAVGLLAAVAAVAQMALLSEIVAGAFVGGEDLARLSPAILLLLGAVFVRGTLLWTREVVARRGAARAKSEIRERLFSHVLGLGPSYAAGERSGELTTTATEGVEKLEPYLARYLPQAALSVLVPLLVCAFVFALDPLSALLLLGTAPMIPVMMILVGSYAEEHAERQWAALSRMGAHFLDALRGLPTLKAFGRSGDERDRVARVGEEFRARTMKVLRYAFLSGLVLEFMTSAAIALVAVSLGVRLINGAIPFEEAFLVLLLAPEFYKPLRELGASRHAALEGRAAASRILEVLETPAPTRGVGRTPHPLPAGAPTVEFRGVRFSYPGSGREALRGVDLTLPAGTTTALVGRSGSGKSTLVDLLLGFADPQEGSIRADGVPLSSLPAEGWREGVALVPQRPYVFHGTVLENIRMARPGARGAEVERAAELSGAHEFVRRLPLGYDAAVGERGARLSGGEAQRLAVARAFLKDAPMLVMDEPTSGLDPESERLIAEALAPLARGRTTLVVAHRLNTAMAADRIAVLEDGRIVEVGAHEELLLRGGAYSRLVRVSPVAKATA